MNIKTLDRLKEQFEDISLYDLTENTFIMYQGAPIRSYITTEWDEMRPDTLCYNIYGNTNHVGFLMKINGILNPMTIRRDSVIIYVDAQSIANFEAPEEVLDEVKRGFINLNKKRKVDKNRLKKGEERVALPPTFNKNKVEPVKIEGNKVTIGKGLFK
jgi:hypothetical protein